MPRGPCTTLEWTPAPPTTRQTSRPPGTRTAHQSSGSSVRPTRPRRVQALMQASGSSDPAPLASVAESFGSDSSSTGIFSSGNRSASSIWIVPKPACATSPWRSWPWRAGASRPAARSAPSPPGARPTRPQPRRPDGGSRTEVCDALTLPAAAGRWREHAAARCQQVELRAGQPGLPLRVADREHVRQAGRIADARPPPGPLFPVAATSSAPRRTSLATPRRTAAERDRGSRARG